MKTYIGTINEIGDSHRPFPYHIEYHALWFLLGRPGGRTNVAIDGMFNTDKQLNYKVEINVIQLRPDLPMRAIVSFETNKGMTVVDKGLEHAFRVMATVIDICKEVLQTLYKKESLLVTTVYFSSSEFNKVGIDTNKAQQRTKLYVAFIRKRWPHTTIAVTKNNVSVNVPVGFYK